MLRYILHRLGWAVLTLFVVLTFVFFLARLTGDPVRLMLPQQATQEDVERVRDSLGLNRPLADQYASFVGSAVQGDLGNSIRQGQPALALIAERLPATLELALISFAVGFTLALGLAVLGEMSGSRTLRNALLWVATARQSVPPYLFGILMVMLFAVYLGWVPAMGRNAPVNYVLPILTIATFEIALYLRLINGSFDQMRSLDWVRTARAKGASRFRIVFRHMLPNALLPVITVAGINLGILVGGLVVLEMVFNWPGVGRLIVQAVTQRDYPLVQAGVLVLAAIFVAINLVVDLLYAVLDPRVRLA